MFPRHSKSFLQCTPRRSIFVAVVGTSVIWMLAVVYFLNLERTDSTPSVLVSHQQAVNPHEVSDELLRELHRRERLQSEPPVDNVLRKQMAAMQEIRQKRIAQHGHLSDDELVKIGREEREQERRLMESRMRQAEETDLEERMRRHAGDNGRAAVNEIHKRELDAIRRRHGNNGKQGAAKSDENPDEDEETEQLQRREQQSRERDEDEKKQFPNADQVPVVVQDNNNNNNNNNKVEESREDENSHDNDHVPVANDDNRVPKHGSQAEKSEQLLKDEKSAGFTRHAFNQQESDRIGDFRDIPDSRNALCKDEKYSAALPKASIIICFHNEALSALRRTVKTAIERGGTGHILEVLLVDDASTMGELQQPLEENMKSISALVRVLHLPDRHGLIRGRVRGAEDAKGEVIVFLDSHCEANENWLVPLIARIHEDRTHVVCPVIDIINLETLDYQASPLVRGGFTWALNFNWEGIPFNSGQEKEMIMPAKSPTMAGGLFAIQRDYFFKIGTYDKGMDIWGGENLEISFRLWMCGGTLEIIPCSRVGHIFRQRRPYDDTAGITAMSKNSVRVAEVWMDEYKELYYQQRTFGSDSAGDVSGRVALRKNLKCKSFQWYLENVYPEKLSALPGDFKAKLEKKAGDEEMKDMPKNIVNHGLLKNIKMDMCLSTSPTSDTQAAHVMLAVCASLQDKLHLSFQTWSLSTDGLLSMGQGTCLAVDMETEKVVVKTCEAGAKEQSWQYFQTKKFVYSRALEKCLRLDMETEGVDLKTCEKSDAGQKWSFSFVTHSA